MCVNCKSIVKSKKDTADSFIFLANYDGQKIVGLQNKRKTSLSEIEEKVKQFKMDQKAIKTTVS